MDQKATGTSADADGPQPRDRSPAADDADMRETSAELYAAWAQITRFLRDTKVAAEHEGLLFDAVVLQTYALAEAHAMQALDLTAPAGGIEQWGAALLSSTGRSWEHVSGGLAGAAEVAVTRNAIVHGGRLLTESSIERLKRAGSSRPWKPGDQIKLSRHATCEHRARLKSLLRCGGFGNQAGLPASVARARLTA